MANRKFLIESILGLAQKIGANPSKFMGTKGNVSFLGTGDRAMKGTTFSGALNKNFLELGVTKDDLIKVIEKDAGYVTADKLNDMQLKTMYDNLTMVDSKINPIENIVKFPEGGINSIPINKQFGGEGITSLRSSPMKKSNDGVKLYGDESFDELLIIDKTGVHPRNKADGGRIGFRSGKSVKEGIAALLKLGNKKFGKDTIKVADDIEPSEFSKFNERNRKLTKDELEDFENEIGDGLEAYDFDGTVASANRILKEQKDYMNSMFTDYKAGRLDPVAGDKSPARMKFLKQKAEEAEMSGDSRLFTADDADELMMLESGSGSSYGGIRNAEVPVEMMTEDLLLAKYPGISERLAKQIGNDKDLQRKAEAIAEIEQTLALQESGKSVDEVIEIMKREPKNKMKKGGLARILEM